MANLLKAYGDKIKSGQLIPKPLVSSSPSGVSSTPSTSGAVKPRIPQPSKPVSSSSSSKSSIPQPTNYGGTGNPLNEILYSKRQYDAGNKSWAQSNAAKYYDQLNPDVANTVRNMNAAQLEAYINERNRSATPTTPTPPSSDIGTSPPIPRPSTGGYSPIPSTQNPGQFIPPPAGGFPQIPIPDQPTIPVMDEDAIRKYAEEQVARRLSDLRLYADQQIRAGQTTADQQLAALQTGFDRQQQTLAEDRGVQNVENARRLSPFSGRSDYALGMIEQERGRTDREMQQDFASRQANVQQDLANLQNTINEKYAAMQNASPQEVEALFQSIKNDERNYELMLRGELRNDMLANSQLNNTAFNQALQQYAANRAAFENDRGFDYGQYQDYVNWTGNLPSFGGYGAQTMGGQGGQGAPMQRTLAGQQLDMAQQQQQQQQELANRQANLDAAFGYMDRSGQILTPQTDWSGYARQIQNGNNPLTLAGQQFQAGEQQRMFENDMTRQQFAEDIRRYGIETAARNAGLSIDQARLALQQDDNLRQWAALDWEMQQPASSGGSNGLTANQVLSSIRSQYMTPQYQTDQFGNQNKIGETLTTNPAQREQMFLQVVDSGLPDTETNQVLAVLGFTRQEIDSYMRKYGGSSGN